MVDRMQLVGTYEYPLVSVLSLTYKKFDYICDAIKSILDQNYPKIELIISDDGSPNFYEAIDKIESCIDQFKRDNLIDVKISHSETNQGTVKNLNNAFRLSAGKYVIGISDDLFFKSDSLINIVNYAEAHSSRITASRTVQFNDEILREYPAEDDMILMDRLSPHELQGLLFFKCCISAPGILYNRQFIEEIGLFNESYKYVEDYPMWLKISKMGVKMDFFNEITVKYRLGGFSNGDSPITSFFNEEIKRVIKEEILDFIDMDNRKLHNKIRNYYIRKQCKKIFYYIENPKVARMNKLKRSIYILRFLDTSLYEKLVRKYLKIKSCKGSQRNG